MFYIINLILAYIVESILPHTLPHVLNNSTFRYAAI